MTDYELKRMVAYWVDYQRDPRSDSKWEAFAATREHLDYLIDCEPWEAWALLSAIHLRDQSAAVSASLCPGPIEDLLARHGPELIATITVFSRKHPSFATLLRSIWRGSMTDEVWSRVQAIRDRRVWRPAADAAD